jgi:hypothetical protein
MTVAPDENGISRVTVATLGAQVTSLERDYADQKRAIVALDNRIDTSISALGNKFESAISVLSNKIDARSTTQWPVLFSGLGVVLTILTILGTMAYLPISRDTGRLDTAVAAILDRGVFQREYMADELRTKEDMRNLRVDLGSRVTLPRYTADQERIVHALDEVRGRFASKTEVEAIFKERQKQVDADSAQLEVLRVRTYDHFGRLTKNEQAVVDLERRFDNISRRVIELNNKIQGSGPRN